MLGKWENSMEKLPRLSFYFQYIHRSQMKGHQADSTAVDSVVIGKDYCQNIQRLVYQ